MEMNDFIAVSKRGIYSPQVFRLFFTWLLVFAIAMLPALWLFRGGEGFGASQYSWSGYAVVLALICTFQQRKFELTVEPLDRIDTDKLVGYFRQKKFEPEHRGDSTVVMRRSSWFGRLLGRDFDAVEIHLEGKLLRLIIPGRMVYDISHTFRWTKDFLRG